MNTVLTINKQKKMKKTTNQEMEEKTLSEEKKMPEPNTPKKL